MTASIREQLLEAITSSFGNMKIGSTATATDGSVVGPFTSQFDLVTRAPLNDLSWNKPYALGIHDMAEKKERKTLFYYCTLPIVFEFRYVLQTSNNEDPSTELNRVLQDVQRWLALDYTWGGLAMNTVETSNEFYIDDINEKRLSGAVFVDVSYRHRWNDPSQH